MSPTISEIQDYLAKYQKPEDEYIDPKSRDRTYRAMAEGVKANKPLPTGRCNLCAREDNRLFPATMTVCMTCCNKFIQRGGKGLKVIKKNVKEYHCDYCMTRCFVSFDINPETCSVCASAIGRTHKYGTKAVIKDKARMEKIKQERFGMEKTTQGGA